MLKIKSLNNAALRIESKTPSKIEAILFYDNQQFLITWYSDDCMIFDCFTDDEELLEVFSNEIDNKLKKEVKKMKKQELFEKAVKAMDNYTKSIEIGLSDFENYYHCQMKELLNQIKAKGLYREFEEFALIG